MTLGMKFLICVILVCALMKALTDGATLIGGIALLLWVGIGYFLANNFDGSIALFFGLGAPAILIAWHQYSEWTTKREASPSQPCSE